jgi:hypothetical protein
MLGKIAGFRFQALENGSASLALQSPVQACWEHSDGAQQQK